MKNCKTFYEAQTASRLMEIVQPPSKPTPNQIKSYYDFGTKFFFRRYTEICGHLLSKCFESRVRKCQEIVQCKCFSSHQTETRFWKICQVRKIFGWLWDFLLENMKLKKTLMSTGTYGQIYKSCTPKWYSQKNKKIQNRNIRFWIIYILVQISFFGYCVRVF